MKSWFWLCVALGFASLAVAQPCQSPTPPEFIPVGSSHCFQVCPGDYFTIQLEGSVIGPGGVPVLTMQAGCQTQNCDVECPPIVPPDSLVFGGDPFAPNDWYGQSACLTIYVRWVHNAVWEYEVFSTCEGCFCLTFDAQLAVELLSFSALPGDGSIELRWTTATEARNDHFELQRDGAEIAEIGAINGAAGETYTWRDLRLTNGCLYHYTLFAVDVNGWREELASLEATPSSVAAHVTNYALQQNFPNPFNANTSITFDVAEPGFVKLTVYDMVGREVSALVRQQLEAARHVVSFDAGDLPSGMYLYRLQVNGFAVQRKMLLIK